MTETAYQSQNQQKNSSKSKLAVIIGLGILIAAIIGGMLYLRPPKKTVEKNNVVITTIPTPTEKPKIDKLTVKIQVVNGTGIAGQAGLVVKALTEAGYSTDNIKSINADKYDNSVTTITGRVNFDEIVNNIADVLKPTFSDIAISSSKLDESSVFDIVILTGGKIATTITPSSSSSSSTSSLSSSSTTPTQTPTPTISPIPTP